MKPPICPRCGNDTFTTSIAFTDEQKALHIYSCSECDLSYEDELEIWRDEQDKEWTMTEAGT